MTDAQARAYTRLQERWAFVDEPINASNLDGLPEGYITTWCYYKATHENLGYDHIYGAGPGIYVGISPEGEVSS